ncbi:GMP synthase [glutamine-hydrolyzing] subunit A [uncultured archaeon]|nr:GMP synthase [glutamine-hydrolyzing] subunit A [uncultured archaeon]
MLLVVDNGSVYTTSILDFLKTTDIKFEQLRFDEIPITSLDRYHSIILSGRRENNPRMNAINAKIVRYAQENQKPLLGICYGAEILALTLGGTIKKMHTARQGLHEIDVIEDNPICNGKIRVFESHSYMIAKLDSSFKQLGKSSSCEFELFQLKEHKIFGTQFHPEMSDDGKNLLGKFISIQ